jgi:hypothetical protein
VIVRQRRIIVAVVVVLLASVWWYLYAGHHAPNGQESLVHLTEQSLDSLRTDFNLAASDIRVILLLSPTWTTCLRGASAVERVLERHAGAPVRLYVVWEPILPTDWTAPSTRVMSRLSDSRARQFWDKDHAVARRMAQDARPPQPAADCCDRSGILWDLAAVYPAGVRWNGALPPAVIFNGPVVDVATGIESTVTAAAK